VVSQNPQNLLEQGEPLLWQVVEIVLVSIVVFIVRVDDWSRGRFVAEVAQHNSPLHDLTDLRGMVELK
jgi:hypothetical protein